MSALPIRYTKNKSEMLNSLTLRIVRFTTLSILFVTTILSPGKSQSSYQRPNILFILVDDLGYNDLGYTGSSYYETPNIDRLAEQGMVFTHAYAASPVCSPSRAAIMTGKYPAKLNLTDYIPGNRHWGPHPDQKLASQPFELALNLSELTLAEALKNEGYSTFFAGKWHLGEAEEYFPEKQGFDINIAGNGTGHPSGGYFSPYANPQLSDGSEGEYLTDRLTDETIQFIKRSRQKPFFAYLSFYTVHLPLQGKPDKVEKYTDKLKTMEYGRQAFTKKEKSYHKQVQNNPQYAAMVESMDENVGLVLKALNENGLSDNTVVIFTSDNGGMSTNNNQDMIPTSNYPLNGGKGYLYEGGIREPLIIRWPGKIDEGSTCNEPITGADFYPTILSMAGAELPPSQATDGIDITPVFKNMQLSERPLFWHYPHYSGGLGGKPSGAVRLGQFKLIEFYEDMHVELYDLAKDQGELNNLSISNPAKTQELRQLLHNWRTSVNAQMPYANPAYQESK